MYMSIKGELIIVLSPMKQLKLMVEDTSIDDRSKLMTAKIMLGLWIYMESKGQPITFTSTVGGSHKPTSKHYKGQASDHIPDKGYSKEYVSCLQDYMISAGIDKHTRTLVEFNNGKPNDANSYRCTHIEWDNKVTAKTGIYALDYAANTTSKLTLL